MVGTHDFLSKFEKMNIKDIKTETEFYEFADIQYQRTDALRRVWQEGNEPIEKKTRAFKLWVIMFKRVLTLRQIAMKLNQVKILKTFEKGSVSSAVNHLLI